ncbi:MAG: peptidylprolyl isomerase, partial [Bacteroidaceae bacterium]|nr:peptidylprolyl isomerase [Bacteroidaceae bacterium]
MNIKKDFIKWLFCSMSLTLTSQFTIAQDNVIDRVEWVVGDKSILRSDIEEAIRYWVASGRVFEGDPYCVVGEDLAVQQLFLHQAAIDSIEIDEANIMRQVEMQMDYVMQQIGSKEKMEE